MGAVGWIRLFRQVVLLASVIVVLWGVMMGSSMPFLVGSLPFWTGVALAALLSFDFVRTGRRRPLGVVYLLPFWATFALPYTGFLEHGPHGSQCVSNLKQLGTAMQMYRTDHDNHLPLARSWYTATYPYTHAAPPDAPTDAGYQLRCPEATSPWSYAMNAKASGTRDSSADLVLIFEGNASLPNASGGPEWLTYRHKDAEFTVVGFADGHSKAYKRETIGAVHWDPRP